MSVKRYEMKTTYRGHESWDSLEEDEEGSYVDYEDYVALEQKLTDMAVQLANAESKCRELAADNEKAMDSLKQADAAVKLAHEKFSALADENMALKSGHYNGMVLPETTATDAFLAEVRASELDSLAGVAETMLIKFSNQSCSSDMHEVVGWKKVLQQATNRAAKLRKGAAYEHWN